jgi:XRE family aerobic/anaerobic benzoate catabolism transcriptional regulator
MKRMTDPVPIRRVSQPSAEAYLRSVGQRVRVERQRRGMSRRVLAETSGVSERYLAELERGAGNASLLLLRQVAAALDLRIEDLASEPEISAQAAE